jgi:hypothetical protein
MRKRGRPSVGDLTTPRALTSVPRLPLPPELHGEEAEEFLRIVNSQAADWFGPPAVALLVQLARHTVQARRIAELIEAAVGRPETELPYYSELLKLQRAESSAIAGILTKCRLTPQSLRNDRGNHKFSPPGRVPPWEWTPRDE